MHVYDTPYVAGISRRVDNIHSDLLSYYKSGSDALVKTGFDHLRELDISVEDIPQWNFPMQIDDIVVIDTRHLKTRDGKVKSAIPYQQLQVQGLMEISWLREKDSLHSVALVAATVFGTWIARQLTTRFNRSVADGVMIQAAFMAYYLTYFLESDDRTLDRLIEGEYDVVMVKQIARSSNIPGPFLSESVLTGNRETSLSAGFFRSPKIRLENVLEWLNERMESPIEDFSVEMLKNMVAVPFHWPSTNGGEMAYVSLYHPPTLLAMVFMTLEYPSYEKSGIGRIVKEVRRQVKLDTVQQWVKRTMHDEQ